MAAGTTEPIAINDVNKTAGAQVCRHFIGFAVVEIEKTENHDGSLFMLAGFRLTEDGALAWTADWRAPFDGSSFRAGLRSSRRQPATNWFTRSRRDRVHSCG